MAMGLGAFTEGLQGGIQARDRMDIAKQYKEKLRQENALGAMDLEARYDMGYDIAEKGTAEDREKFLARNKRYEMGNDLPLIRLGKWIGRKTGLFNEEAGAEAGASFSTPPAPSNVPMQSPLPEDQMPPTKLANYKDGGRVTGRDRYGSEEESLNYGIPTRTSRDSLYSEDVNMGLDDFSLPEDRGGPNLFPRTRAAWADKQDYEQVLRGEFADKVERDGWNAYDVGEATRKEAGSSIAGTVRAGAALGRDIVDHLVPDAAVEFGKGFLGIDGGGDEAVPTSTEAPPSLRQNPEDVGPPVPEGIGEDKKAATDATAPAPRRTDADMADQAIDDGTMMALENLDFRTLTAQGLTPNDLPQMPTQEWVGFRSSMMTNLIKQGKDPSEALKITDDITVGVQMRGFQRYGQQASQYLMAGLQDEAAMAMTMAFQYFPNGASVQWANFTDPKTGRAALVARGFDEETGEPRGAPQLITADRLNVMMEQFTDPKAFRTWTKDNRQLQLDIAKHKETVAHHGTMEDIYAYGAETDRIKALTDRLDTMLGGGKEGIKLTDIDRRIGELKENMKRSVMYEDDIAESLPLQEDLLAIMAVYLQRTGFDAETVTQQVMEQYRAGREQGGTEAGIAAAMALLRQPQG